MVDNLSSSRQSQDASSTFVPIIQPPASVSIGSDGATSSSANKDTIGINPTPSNSVGTPYFTNLGQSHQSKLLSSYGDQKSDSSQFPMQHATQLLSGDALPLATTQYSSSESQQSQPSQSKPESGTVSSASVSKHISAIHVTSSSDIASASVSKDSTVAKDTIVPTAKADAGQSSSQDATSSRNNHLQSSKSSFDKKSVIKDTVGSSDYKPSVSDTDSATQFNSQSILNSLTLTSAASSGPQFPRGSSARLKISASSSLDYEATSRELYSTFTPSQTSFVSSAILIDSTATLKTTPAIPLTPPSSKPVSPSDTGQTSLLGGGLSNNIIYIGVPLCGLGILIFLIICIICLRKRKAKTKGSPAKNHVQDLWVNSQPEIALSSQSPLHEANGGEGIGGQKDLALKKKDKQKKKKIRYKWEETIGKDNESENDNIPLVSEDNCKSENYTEDVIESDFTESDIDQTENIEVGESDNTDDEIGREEGDEDDTEEESEEFCNKGEDIDKDCRRENESADENVDGDEHLVDEEGCTTYESLYDFDGELDTHLRLRQGDLVRVHRKEDNGWWRGTVGDQTGWFPSNFVQAAPQDKLETENEVEMHNESHVTSFMVKRRSGSSQRDSYPTEEDIEAEPIYCKIQPKEKRKSAPKVAEKPHFKHGPLHNRENTPIPIEDGTRFVAIYQYAGHFHGELSINKGDVILGHEQDRNGWMNGYNETSKEDGWFPAVYAEKLDKDESTQLDPDPTSYKHLEANTRADSKQDLVGIVHRTIHTFTAEKAGDLEFEEGELITVFQILENGWWLGCKDKTVGWFPGSFVEMIDQPSPSNKMSPSPTSKSSSESPFNADGNPNNKPKQHKPTKLRPARKAPPPPKLDINPEINLPIPSGSKIPTGPRNKGAPPVPPVRSGTNDVSPLYETIGQKITNGNPIKSDNVHKPVKEGFYELIKHPDTEDDDKAYVKPKDVNKPEIPKRYIKPKLVTIPRSAVNMPNNLTRDSGGSGASRSRPPPPPRPIPPRLGPVRTKLKAPHPFEHQPQSEEEDGFFNLAPQRKFDPVVKQESSELDHDSPYKSLSSFGTFGSSFGKKESSAPAENMIAVQNQTQVNEKIHDKDTQKKEIPKLVKQKSITDDEADVNFSFNQDGLVSDLKKDSEHVNSVEKDRPVQIKEDNNDNMSNIENPLPQNPKKKEKSVSKLQAPKHISLQPAVNAVAPSECKGSKSPDTPVSKIPRVPIGSENVSKLPMTHKESPCKLQEEHKKTSLPVNVHENFVESDVGNKADIEHIISRDSPVDDMRPRTESFDKPPVAPKPKSKGIPKVLPKPKANVKVHEKEAHNDNEADKVHINVTTDHSKSIPTSPDVRDRKSESENEQKDESKVSKIPLGSKITQKSPQMRGRKSQIPASPHMRKKSSDRQDKPLSIRKTSESDSDAPMSPNTSLRNKQESPRSTRKASPRQQMTNSDTNLRNRSNSPRGNRTGIPTTVRQRSNSPATKLAKPSSIPLPGTTSPSVSNSKLSGLAPPKKIVNGQGRHSPNSESNSPRSQSTPSPDAIQERLLDEEVESLSPKPDRPSKPPRVQKQKSLDGKPPKHGKSLLPVIHKSMDAGGSPNGVASPTSGSKTKRGIPVAKPPRPPVPRSPSDDEDQRLASKRTLYQAVKGYTAQSDGELSFTEGTFVKELSDCDRVGWYVGMLTDGTTGLYPANHVMPSPLDGQSEA